LPGGPACVEDGFVHDSVLAQADSARALPRLGGMARPDGVVVVSERFWAHARVDGSVREGSMPAVATAFRRVPLVRGLARIAASVSPLFRRTGVARRPERLLLAAALVAPCGFLFLPGVAGVIAGIAITAGLVAWLLRGRTLFLHGAEHRAIAAAEERRLVETWAGEARPSRFSLRCGTNFAVLVLPVAVLADLLWPLPTTLFTPVAVAVLALALTMELWLVVQASQRRLARIFLLPGICLQRLTTREPALAETRVALAAVASVLRRELDAL
jgi:uncharacterized protein YqhQ